MIRPLLLVTTLIASLLFACVYTLSGSSLPSHLKTVEIPLFTNQTLEPNIAEEITAKLSQEIVSGNLLKVVESGGTAVLSGTVTEYKNEPYTFGAATTRQVEVQQYVVRITVDVEFLDVKKDEPIYKGKVTGEGIYELSKQTQQDGKNAAIKQIVERVLANSVQGW